MTLSQGFQQFEEDVAKNCRWIVAGKVVSRHGTDNKLEATSMLDGSPYNRQ